MMISTAGPARRAAKAHAAGETGRITGRLALTVRS